MTEEYQQTAIGKIPRDWKVVKAKEVFSLEYGKGLPEKRRVSGKYPVVGSNGVVGYHNQALVSGPGIVVGRKGTIGAISWIESDFWPIDTTYYVKLKKENVSLKWLFFKLSHLNLERFNLSDVVPGLKRDLVYNMKFSLPPLPEQRRIVEVLSSIDNAIQRADESIAKTEKLKRGLMQKLLTEGIGHKEFKTTKIGRLPATWEVTKLRHLIEKGIITYHLDGNHGVLYPREEEFVDQGVPFLSANMLVDGTIDFTKAKYVTEERAKQFRKGIAKDGDVLFAHNATVGPVGILSTDLPFVIVGTSLTCYRCNPDHLHNYYLKYFMESVHFQKQYRPIMKQSTRNQVPITAQRDFRFIIPPVNEQKKIANILSTVEHKLRLEKKRKHKLERIKRGLMNVLLTGKRRVKVAM